MAEEGQAQGPSLEQLVTQLAGQVSQVAQNQAAQARALQQLAQLPQATAQAVQQTARATPDPDAYTKLNDQYLKTLATDPIGLRNAEKQQIASEIANAMRQEFHQRLSVVEQQRRAEEMERALYVQNPDLQQEGPYLNFYMEHINKNPQYQGWDINQRISQAVAWTREFKEERYKQDVARYEQEKRNQARASSPAGASFHDPGRADVETAESAEVANQKRFEVLQGRKAAAMGGGRYGR